MSAQENTLQLAIDQNLDYKYRDLFNLHVGAEDVVIEFGNIHRGQENQGCISDRIVLSPGNAVRLQQALTQSLQQMQERMREIAENHRNQPQEESDASNN